MPNSVSGIHAKSKSNYSVQLSHTAECDVHNFHIEMFAVNVMYTPYSVYEEGNSPQSPHPVSGIALAHGPRCAAAKKSRIFEYLIMRIRTNT